MENNKTLLTQTNNMKKYVIKWKVSKHGFFHDNILSEGIEIIEAKTPEKAEKTFKEKNSSIIFQYSLYGYSTYILDINQI